MITLPVETVAAGGYVDVGAGTSRTAATIVLYNESPNLVMVQWGASSMWLPAWTGDRFDMALDAGYNGNFRLVGQSISTATGAPSSVVMGNVYAAGEHIPGTFPVALVRQTNLGNSVPVSTSTNQVINDGNAAGTQVLEATPTGAGGSQAIITNQGAATLGGGNVTLDTAGNLAGLASLSSDGGAVVSNGSGSLTAVAFNGRIHGVFGNSAWNGQSFPGGTGSGTFSHSLGTTPTWAGPICTTTNSSQTQGFDTLTATTLHVTSGAGFSWLAMLIKAS